MKNLLKFPIMTCLFLVITFSSCKKDAATPIDEKPAPSESLILSGNITSDLSLRENSSYTLKDGLHSL
ncbi:MAG: hypothetical protein ACYCZO_09940 [Daejeonella sp.]